MKVTIDIPKEFEADWLHDIEESLGRLMVDAHSLAGNYEKETAQMLINAFKEGDVSSQTVTKCRDCRYGEMIDSDGIRFCNNFSELVLGNGYCSQAERRDDG